VLLTVFIIHRVREQRKQNMESIRNQT